MTEELTRGAERIERRVRERAEDSRVAVLSLKWNGDEGLRRDSELQTLFIEGMEKTARVALTSDQVCMASEGGVTPDVDALFEEALNSIHVPASPQPPEGGAG
ncbi:hypothetical protein [Arhodomonas sp. AD133]|uniref:hypothetical protein n=1 Tax=Arhodomonas sp. AD133 TaxID=3415009 RepID=UPI003EBFF100